MTNQMELNSFLLCLLNAIGFDSECIILGNYVKYESLSPAQAKKQKTYEKGSNEVSTAISHKYRYLNFIVIQENL